MSKSDERVYLRLTPELRGVFQKAADEYGAPLATFIKGCAVAGLRTHLAQPSPVADLLARPTYAPVPPASAPIKPQTSVSGRAASQEGVQTYAPDPTPKASATPSQNVNDMSMDEVLELFDKLPDTSQASRPSVTQPEVSQPVQQVLVGMAVSDKRRRSDGFVPIDYEDVWPDITNCRKRSEVEEWVNEGLTHGEMRKLARLPLMDEN